MIFLLPIVAVGSQSCKLLMKILLWDLHADLGVKTHRKCSYSPPVRLKPSPNVMVCAALSVWKNLKWAWRPLGRILKFLWNETGVKKKIPKIILQLPHYSFFFFLLSPKRNEVNPIAKHNASVTTACMSGYGRPWAKNGQTCMGHEAGPHETLMS